MAAFSPSVFRDPACCSGRAGAQAHHPALLLCGHNTRFTSDYFKPNDGVVRTLSTKDGVIASIPENRMNICCLTTHVYGTTQTTHHSTNCACGDCVTHVTSTLGDVLFTLNVLKSELRSFTLQRRHHTTTLQHNPTQHQPAHTTFCITHSK